MAVKTRVFEKIERAPIRGARVHFHIVLLRLKELLFTLSIALRVKV